MKFNRQFYKHFDFYFDILFLSWFGYDLIKDWPRHDWVLIILGSIMVLAALYCLIRDLTITSKG